MEIQWLGHSAFCISVDGKSVLVDPYFSGNPACPPDVQKLIGKVDHILITHGHGDHMGDTLDIAREHGAAGYLHFRGCFMAGK